MGPALVLLAPKGSRGPGTCSLRHLAPAAGPEVMLRCGAARWQLPGLGRPVPEPLVLSWSLCSPSQTPEAAGQWLSCSFPSCWCLGPLGRCRWHQAGLCPGLGLSACSERRAASWIWGWMLRNGGCWQGGPGAAAERAPGPGAAQPGRGTLGAWISLGALLALRICESSETPFRILLKASGQFSPFLFLLNVRGREFRKVCFVSHPSCVREEPEPSLTAAASRASRPPPGLRRAAVPPAAFRVPAAAAPRRGSSALGSSGVTLVARGGVSRASWARSASPCRAADVPNRGSGRSAVPLPRCLQSNRALGRG